MSFLLKIPRESLRERVHRVLQAAIVSGELKPLERLRDQEVATQLGVSRTPVREALRRLQDAGLVEAVPGALTRVTPLDSRKAREAFPVAAVLHGLATRLSVGLITQTQLCAMEEANAALWSAIEAGNTPGAIQADDQFHGVMVEVSGNREIMAALERVMPMVRRLEYAQFGSTAGRQSCRQHAEILVALRQGQWQRAATLVEENWLSLGHLIVEGLEQSEGGRPHA